MLPENENDSETPDYFVEVSGLLGGKGETREGVNGEHGNLEDLGTGSNTRMMNLFADSLQSRSYTIPKDYPSISRGMTFHQVPVIHETGHALGLNHPGKPDPKDPNGLGEYYADPGSLMGAGSKLRDKDFVKAFCDHIKDK